VISGAIFDLDGTIATRDEILSFFARRLAPSA
jgi:phosphoserine phosphatase